MHDGKTMRDGKNFRLSARRQAAAMLIGSIFAAGLAMTVHAASQPNRIAVVGVTVEAKLIPIRWLGLIPTQAVRFELAITVEPRMKSFSEIHYECLFVDAAGTEIGIASRGSASRDAFTTTKDGWLVSVTHEELGDIGPVTLRCRATKLEK